MSRSSHRVDRRESRSVAALARRFSLSDWQWLCSRSAFLAALEHGPLESEVVAWTILHDRRERGEA